MKSVKMELSAFVISYRFDLSLRVRECKQAEMLLVLTLSFALPPQTDSSSSPSKAAFRRGRPAPLQHPKSLPSST